MAVSSPFGGPPGNNYSGHHTTTTTTVGAPSPLKFIRDGSVDGTLSPVSSKSGGTDTDLEFKKKVRTACSQLLSQGVFVFHAPSFTFSDREPR